MPEASQPTQESNQLSLPLDKGKAADAIIELPWPIENPRLLGFPSIQDVSVETNSHDIEDLKY